MKNLLLVLILALFCPSVLGQKKFSANVSPGGEVSFKNKDVILSGSLILPQVPSDNKAPAFIFISGSGDASYRSHFKEGASYTFYKDVTNYFVQNGYAVLLLDKRGINKSTGDWRKSGFKTYAEDIYLAIRFLKSRPEIDAANISLLGHSQGGYIGQIVAATHPEEVSLFINLVGPAENVFKQVLFDMNNRYQCDGKSGFTLGLKMLTLKSSLHIARAVSYVAKPMFITQVIRHDPAKYVPKISCPTLSIFAENDIMVDEVANTELMYKLASDKKDLHTIHIIKGINHHFFNTPLCYDWDTADKTINPELFTIINNWLTTLPKGEAKKYSIY